MRVGGVVAEVLRLRLAVEIEEFDLFELVGGPLEGQCRFGYSRLPQMDNAALHMKLET